VAYVTLCCFRVLICQLSGSLFFSTTCEIYYFVEFDMFRTLLQCNFQWIEVWNWSTKNKSFFVEKWKRKSEYWMNIEINLFDKKSISLFLFISMFVWRFFQFEEWIEMFDNELCCFFLHFCNSETMFDIVIEINRRVDNQSKSELNRNPTLKIANKKWNFNRNISFSIIL
jgi:hypothetical protein